MDLIPIWKTKIHQTVSRSKLLFPDSQLIRTTINQVYTSPAKGLKITLKNSKSTFKKEIRGFTAPDDGMELLEVIELLYGLHKEKDLKEEVLKAHKRLFAVAKLRFKNDDTMITKLNDYKIREKILGLF